MKVYTVTVNSQNELNRDEKGFNLVEHDSDALMDPSTKKAIGRKVMASRLTYAEANAMKNELDLAQGTHPLFRPLDPLLPEDAKPSTAKIFLPSGQVAS